MLISTPFLTAQTVHPAAPSELQGISLSFSGEYPVTSHMEWHNGVHLIAPVDVDRHADVRAVADGRVIYVRAPDAQPNRDKTHPQNYATFGDTPEWTDKGMVIVEHRTEIGAAGSRPTELVYYSVYAHLCRLAEGVAKDKPVYRKDRLGQAGQIYGQHAHIHFEICLDDANLQKLLGHAPEQRTHAETAPTCDGRTDAVFGSAYIYLPADTPVQAQRPGSHMRGSTGNSLGAAQWVRIEYAGHATLTSHTLTGKPIGQPVVEVDGEYRLHLEAQARHDSLSPGDKAKSSPSGWYELLRFGRNLGRGEAAADKDPLPNNAAHWRKINTPAGERWVDLNATGTFKLSDADFPNCAGWTCIADDTSTEDQRCDSVRLKALITSDITDMAIKAATFKNPAQLFAASNKPAIRKKLRRAICKFPSEFDQGTFERRYGHIREETYFQENPGSWEKLKAHIQAMTCTDLPAAYKNAQWHFHPLEFIEHMRKCMWLSKQELVQLVPSHAVRTGQWKDAQGNRQAGVFWEMVRRPDTESDESIIAKHRIPLNRTMRKYGINTSLRQASFLSNAIQESGWLARLQELGGDGYWYTPWHGRGLLQLTHPGNYFAYWEWRGRSIPLPLKQVMQKAAETEAKKAPDLRSKAAMQDAHFPGLTPEILKWRSDVDGAAGTQREPTGDALVAPSDSAGHYAAVKGLVRQADGAHEVERRSVSIVDAKGQSQGERVYYRSQAFWKVSASINLPAAVHREDYRGINGFDSRGSAYGVALAVLTEIRLPDVKGNKLIEYPEGYAPRRSAP